MTTYRPETVTVGSGTGAVTQCGDRPDSLEFQRFPVRLSHCRGRDQCVPFPVPAHRTVHAVLPHTAHRRRSPPAFGFSRQGLPALGETTIPYRLIRPHSS